MAAGMMIKEAAYLHASPPLSLSPSLTLPWIVQGIKMEISTLPILCLYYDKKQVVQSSNHPYH